MTMIVPAQDWSTRFTKLQGMFPQWAHADHQLPRQLHQHGQLLCRNHLRGLTPSSRPQRWALADAFFSSQQIPCQWVSLTASTTSRASSMTILQCTSRLGRRVQWRLNPCTSYGLLSLWRSSSSAQRLPIPGFPSREELSTDEPVG